MTGAARAIGILHGVLSVGAAVIAVVLIGLEAARGPLLGDDPQVGLIGSILGGIGLVAILVAVLVLKPRVPGQRGEQSAEQYWSEERSRTSALLVWVAAEGGSIVSVVGYLLSGALLPLIAAGIGLGVLFLTRPFSLVPGP